MGKKECFFITINIVLCFCMIELSSCVKNQNNHDFIIKNYNQLFLKASNNLHFLEDEYVDLMDQKNLSAIEKEKLKASHILIRRIKTLFYLENTYYKMIIKIGMLNKDELKIDNVLFSEILKISNPLKSKTILYARKIDIREYFIYLLEILDEKKIDLVLTENKNEEQREDAISIGHSIIEIEYGISFRGDNGKELEKLINKLPYYEKQAKLFE
jgi:hypothetical protein